MKQLERNIQIRIVKYLRFYDILVFSIPNGGSRNLLEAVNLKKSGLLPGCSDLIIVLKNKVVFVELKTDKGKQSPYQKEFQQKVEALGHEYCVWRSLDDAIEFVNNLKMN